MPIKKFVVVQVGSCLVIKKVHPCLMQHYIDYFKLGNIKIRSGGPFQSNNVFAIKYIKSFMKQITDPYIDAL